MKGLFLFFCLYSDGPLVGVPFIDDYISTTEQVSVLLPSKRLGSGTKFMLCNLTEKLGIVWG